MPEETETRGKTDNGKQLYESGGKKKKGKILMFISKGSLFDRLEEGGGRSNEIGRGRTQSLLGVEVFPSARGKRGLACQGGGGGVSRKDYLRKENALQGFEKGWHEQGELTRDHQRGRLIRGGGGKRKGEGALLELESK